MGRKMKDSGIEWIGEIPEGWEVTKLKYLATFPIEKNAHIDSPYIGLENIESWTGKYVSSDSQYDKSQALTFSRNNILFGKLRPYLAKVFCASNDGCCSSEFCILNFSSSVNIRYFWNLLISPTFIDHVTKSTYGTKMPRANTDFIKNICAPVPPRIEQDRIALYLDASSAKIDSLISETRSSIEEYKKLKQAVITQAVATQQCSHIKLKYLMNVIVDCPHETPTYSFTGNYYVIRTADQALASLRCDEDMYRLDASEYKKRTRRLTLDKDDIVYGREGSWGLACLVPQSNKYCLGQRVMQFRCNTRLLYPKYAMYALNSETVYMQGALDTIGSTAPHVNISTICNYLLPVPALNEQKEITNYLDAKCAEIAGLIAKKEQLVKELENYKKSLIYEVVTGKREV